MTSEAPVKLVPVCEILTEAPRIARVRRKGRNRRCANTAGIAGDREQIPDNVIRVRRDIPLSVNHLRELS